MIPTAADTRIIIEIVMNESPEELKEMGLENVYKIPDITVLSIEPITEAHQYTPTMFESVQNSASTGYLVKLSIPENAYVTAIELLHEEPFVTKINGSKTTSGVMIENKISAICPQEQYTDGEPAPETSCCVS